MIAITILSNLHKLAMAYPMPRHDPDLLKRNTPIQERGERTIEKILSATANLLATVGFEQMSTNMICAEAGLTPPALYRYFPNKHAVVKELGERLMMLQNTVFNDWLSDGYDPDDLPASFERMIREQLAVSKSMPHSEWIFRALHASPSLSEVRLASHREVTEQLTHWAIGRWPYLDPDTCRTHFRLAIELGYAAMEMIVDLEEGDQSPYYKMTATVMANFHQSLLDS